MNILLMSMPACAPHFNAKRWKPPNLAISSIAGNIEGHNVSIADLILRRARIAETVRELISKYQPDVVGLTAMSFQFATAGKIASLIKGLNRNIKIVLGGYHATVMYDEVCKGDEADPFDFFVRGEGDLCFNKLLEAINGKKPIETVLGVSFRNDGRFIHNSQRPLEDLQFLRWKYKRKYSTFFKTTPVFKANFPRIDLLRIFILRPYYRIKNFITSMGKSECDIFERDRKRFAEMNNFFNRP